MNREHCEQKEKREEEDKSKSGSLMIKILKNQNFPSLVWGALLLTHSNCISEMILCSLCSPANPALDQILANIATFILKINKPLDQKICN